MTRSQRQFLSLAALLLGLGLLALTLIHVDLGSIDRLARQLGAALPIVLLPSAAWHLVRTAAWQRCFPAGEHPPFARAVRVRLAAEAFSFVTIRGVAGEPLKVVLLAPEIPTAVSAAAVALERAAYLLITAVIIVIAALVAAATLALSGLWIRVFGVTAGVSIVLIVALLRVAARPERQPQQSSHTTGAERRSFFARFAHQFVQQLRNLLRRDRRRLAVLVAFESAAFALMALEVWVALWAAGTPVTAVAALAAETFTRVASFASAFIPANLGALEASNVVAANAVGAAGGAAALALVRRLRGLFWCVVGFAIYPRRERAPDKAPRLVNEDVHDNPLVILEEAGSDVSLLDQVGGLPIGERLARAAARAGYQRLLVWAPRQRREWRQLATRLPDGIRMTVIDDHADWQKELAELKQPESPRVVTSDFVPLRVDETGSLQGIRVGSRQDLPRAERELRQSVFKPTDGRLGRFNRRMSLPVSIALIRWVRLSPHVMSAWIIGLGLYSGWLFSDGAYLTGVLAALVSLAASILDGSDGELARLQYKESAFGCWLDTVGDYTYYLAIFVGLTVGTVRQTGWSGFWWVGASLLTGTLLTFVLMILLRRRITNGRPDEFRTIAKSHFYGQRKRWAFVVAKLSNCATRATMPYGILALALLNLLPVVLILAALGAQIYWISLAVQLRKLLAAGRPIEALV
jgi:phosphatidylglycerophosphate synthase